VCAFVQHNKRVQLITGQQKNSTKFQHFGDDFKWHWSLYRMYIQTGCQNQKNATLVTELLKEKFYIQDVPNKFLHFSQN
jgi:hypothetical protein